MTLSLSHAAVTPNISYVEQHRPMDFVNVGWQGYGVVKVMTWDVYIVDELMVNWILSKQSCLMLYDDTATALEF